MKKALDNEIIEKIKPWFSDFRIEDVKISTSESDVGMILAKLFRATGIAPFPNDTIYIVPEYYQPESLDTLGIIAHECEHLRQQERMGWLFWIIKYLAERLFLILKYLPEIIRSRNIYLHYGELSLEKEAMIVERKVKDFYERG